MKKPDTTIEYVYPESLADLSGLKKGDKLLTINGNEFYDILEYRYLISEEEVELLVEKKNGKREIILIENDYEDLGIEFKKGIIAEAKSCKNKCIFCFIDQLPKGMRETVYFKDDDTRLSFLQGNYVTLTNMEDEEIDRMIKMRISPINISVHTTNPELRCKMLSNRFAGKIFDIMKKFRDAGLYMNCQIVLCKGYNDKEELSRTISDLYSLMPNVISLSVVPVGLTAHREGLCPLTPFNEAEANEVIQEVETWQRKIEKEFGSKMVYASDEFYLMAKKEIPHSNEYEGFPQIENGVGLIASLREEFYEAIRLVKDKKREKKVLIATGELAYDFIKSLADELMRICKGIRIEVVAIKNNFFGGGVNVAGLVTGADLINQIGRREDVDLVAIPSVMLRDGEDVFLDDVTLIEAKMKIGTKIEVINNDGYEFVEKILGEELIF